ncbi:hypothetical protein EMIHUDRAFT_458999 [Emiliania huxleyi CCMP1516]|uniref:Peptidase C1A papain C-terminal domain-containing protein n=2 Tax=Emiliania huxleyi TaxID=2903 RepID=A0A0D3J189_EMIH1|nr:hypothetical protein EMIHUDRAFT_458999 [Emiliania huxleyi CCMP1516]EOD17274.1 hypothetical protein EMIHUDRAFT_458999 [Emiliania huxleyi CCMP1516]|eukprot:XP_005769703.1 hypothetical protein EMIHUDRAFT_458999 [Emiliania huxleyi CCMP1516]
MTTPPTFADWKLAHGRSYATVAEEASRLGIWERAKLAVETSSQANPHARFELDWTADWTASELSGLRGGPIDTAGTERRLPFDEASIREAGPIDWVSRGAVNPPISQGRCGTCAQFSATADIEAQWFLRGHGLVKLSEQEMIDCASYTGPYGMGWVSSVHKGLAPKKTESNHAALFHSRLSAARPAIGLAPSAVYPLANHSDPTIRGCRSPCNATAADPALSAAHISGASCLVHADEAQMLAWLQHGPLSVSIDASLQGYRGGVISGAGCNHTRVDHAVLLVGFGVDTSVEPWLPFWKLKNSWGPGFGEGGYVRVQAGANSSWGNCLGLRGACQAYIGEPPKGLGKGRAGRLRGAAV